MTHLKLGLICLSRHGDFRDPWQQLVQKVILAILRRAHAIVTIENSEHVALQALAAWYLKVCRDQRLILRITSQPCKP